MTTPRNEAVARLRDGLLAIEETSTDSKSRALAATLAASFDAALEAARAEGRREADEWWATRFAAGYKSDGSGMRPYMDMTIRAEDYFDQHVEGGWPLPRIDRNDPRLVARHGRSSDPEPEPLQRSPADPRDLIEAATPLPWAIDDTTDHTIDLCCGEDGVNHTHTRTAWFKGDVGSVDVGDYSTLRLADGKLIVYAVNNLPALLDVAEALERLANAAEENLFFGPEGDRVLMAAMFSARRALARLRENQP